MKKRYTIGLSTKDLQKFKDKIDEWDNLMQKASEKIVKDIAEYGLEEMKNNYAARGTTAGTYMDFSITENGTEKKVAMSGPQALYEEFGTGTEGENAPHPMKNDFALNPYNSGRTIRRASKKVSEKSPIPEGELYWTYKGEDGEIHYTQGVSAGKEVLDSFNSAKEKSIEIITKDLEEVLR